MAAALIGLLGGLLSGLLGGFLSARLAIGAWKRARQDAVAAQAVQAVRDLAMELARASHNACWLTWKAKYDQDRLVSEDMDRYDRETHENFPKLLGAQAALAAIDKHSADITKEAVEKVTKLDVKIGLASVGWRKNEKKRLASLHAVSLRVHDEVTIAIKDTAAEILIGSFEQARK